MERFILRAEFKELAPTKLDEIASPRSSARKFVFQYMMEIRDSNSKQTKRKQILVQNRLRVDDFARSPKAAKQTHDASQNIINP